MEPTLCRECLHSPFLSVGGKGQSVEVVHECALYLFIFSTDDPVILRNKTLHIAKCFWKLQTSKNMEFDTSGQEKQV